MHFAAIGNAALFSLVLEVAHAFSSTDKTTAECMNLMVLGLGRVGREIVQEAVASSFLESVTGTVRGSPELLTTPTGLDMRVISTYDIDHITRILPTCSHLLTTIPPPRKQDIQLEALYDTVEKNLPANCWVGVISTTGVYGNHDGAWVTEDSECKWDEDSGTAPHPFLAMESAWKERTHRAGHRLRVFRCAGIYGPGRSALHTVFRRGWTLSTDGGTQNTDAEPKQSGVTNRIHSKDLARAVLSSMRANEDVGGSHQLDQYRVYNLADDMPEARHVVMKYAIQLLEESGIQPDVSTSSRIRRNVTPASRARRRGRAQKRVSNARMREELLGKDGLCFPTYKEGLHAVFRIEDSPWWSSTGQETQFSTI